MEKSFINIPFFHLLLGKFKLVIQFYEIMKLSEKFGHNAVKAVELLHKGIVKSPQEAWKKAGNEILEKRVYVEKGCPKSAFLGLCEEGLVKGVPAGRYTRSTRNKKYTIDGYNALKKNPSLRYDIKAFWDYVKPNETISHNYQLDVLVHLYESSLLNLDAR